MINELRAVAIFVEVVRAGSFRGAAKQLKLSPSAVSYNVAQLEKRVGNALIYRSTRKLSLTKEGEHLFEVASNLLFDVSASLDKISGFTSELNGRLIVSATSALLHSSLNQKVAQFCKENPRVNCEIHYSDERQDLIRDGIDVALRAGEMPDSSLKSKLVARVERKLVCSKKYYQSKKRPRNPGDLNSWQWIRLTMMPPGRVLRKSGKTVSTADTTSQISVNNIDAMVQFCSLGLGLATPPAFLVEKLVKRGSMIEVLPDWQVESIPVYAVWPGNRVRNRNAEKFVGLITGLGA